MMYKCMMSLFLNYSVSLLFISGIFLSSSCSFLIRINDAVSFTSQWPSASVSSTVASRAVV